MSVLSFVLFFASLLADRLPRRCVDLTARFDVASKSTTTALATLSGPKSLARWPQRVSFQPQGGRDRIGYSELAAKLKGKKGDAANRRRR